MSAFIPENRTFDRILTAIKQDDNQLCCPADPDFFMEKLINLVIDSVNKKYSDQVPNIDSDTYKPEKRYASHFQIIKHMDCVNYQIDYPELDWQTYAAFQTIRNAYANACSGVTRTHEYDMADWE